MSYIADIDWNQAFRQPLNDQDFIENCLSSKLWRMNNLYKVKNKQGNIVPFVMNSLQRKVAEVKHNRKIVLKTRQVGITTYHLLYNFDDCLFEPNNTNGIMAQDLLSAGEFLDKAQVAWDYLDPAVKAFLNIRITTNNTSEMSFSNRSKLLVRTSFRSGTLQNLHVSELGKIAARDPVKAKELKTGTFQAIGDNRKVTVESTGEGKSGYFYELWALAENHIGEYSELDFYPIFIGWTEDPDCTLETEQFVSPAMAEYFESIEAVLGITLTVQQKNFYIAKKRELGEHMTQEYPSTPEEAFQAARDGTYYAKEMKNIRKRQRIVSTPLYDPMLRVSVAMDLGMNDDFFMVFFQEYRGEVRIIDEYVANGEGILHYVNVMKKKPYRYNHIYGPHDIRVRELGTGKTRWEVFRELGVYVHQVDNVAINDGIEAVRILLMSCWIYEGCEQVILCLDNYSKEWDERFNKWKNKPLHNEFSHGADALRYLALSDDIGELAAVQGSEYREGGGQALPAPQNGVDI